MAGKKGKGKAKAKDQSRDTEAPGESSNTVPVPTTKEAKDVDESSELAPLRGRWENNMLQGLSGNTLLNFYQIDRAIYLYIYPNDTSTKKYLEDNEKTASLCAAFKHEVILSHKPKADPARTSLLYGAVAKHCLRESLNVDLNNNEGDKKGSRQITERLKAVMYYLTNKNGELAAKIETEYEDVWDRMNKYIGEFYDNPGMYPQIKTLEDCMNNSKMIIVDRLNDLALFLWAKDQAINTLTPAKKAIETYLAVPDIHRSQLNNERMHKYLINRRDTIWWLSHRAPCKGLYQHDEWVRSRWDDLQNSWARYKSTLSETSYGVKSARNIELALQCMREVAKDSSNDRENPPQNEPPSGYAGSPSEGSDDSRDSEVPEISDMMETLQVDEGSAGAGP